MFCTICGDPLALASYGSSPPALAATTRHRWFCQQAIWLQPETILEQGEPLGAADAQRNGGNCALTDHSTAKMGSGNQQNLPGIVNI